MTPELIVGILALGVPLLAGGYLMLRRNRGVFGMYLGMIVIGLGYLTATGALVDIGHKVMGAAGKGSAVEAPAATPATAPAPAEPTPPAETPPAASDPEPAPSAETPPPASEPAPEASEPAPADAPAP